MKKWIGLLLCLTLLAGAVSAAAAEGIAAVMRVVNCKEWVSLREKPATSSARLAKVPLDALVENCEQASDTFIRCTFNGRTGYILAEYLTPLETAARAQDEEETDSGRTTFLSLPYLPNYDLFLATGHNALTYTQNGYTLVVQNAYSDWEEIMAVCYDQNRTPLWQVKEAAAGELSEVMQTCAFIGGTAQDPQLILFINGKGFTAYDIGPWARVRWTLPESPQIDITNSILTAVDEDGTIYAAFDDKLLSISPEGKLNWKTSCENPGIYAPQRIEFKGKNINISYDNHPELDGVYTMVTFGKNGSILQVSIKS